MLPLSNQQSKTSGTRRSTVPGTDNDGIVRLSMLQRSQLTYMHLKPAYKNLVKKVKANIALPGKPISELRGCHLPYGITQCYLPPDTNESSPPKPRHAGWYSIYLPRRDGRLSGPRWLDRCWCKAGLRDQWHSFIKYATAQIPLPV